MRLNDILVGAAVSIPLISGGCADLPSSDAVKVLNLSDKGKLDYILCQQLAGRSYAGNTTYHSVLARDRNGAGCVTDARGTKDMPKEGHFEIHDMFQEGGHYFATMVDPERDGMHCLRIFIDDCIAVGWHNEGVPNLVIATKGMYDHNLDESGLVIGNTFNEEIGRRYVNTFLKPDKAASEFYTVALNALAEKHATGNVSRWTLYRLEVARVKLVDSIIAQNSGRDPQASN